MLRASKPEIAHESLSAAPRSAYRALLSKVHRWQCKVQAGGAFSAGPASSEGAGAGGWGEGGQGKSTGVRGPQGRETPQASVSVHLLCTPGHSCWALSLLWMQPHEPCSWGAQDWKKLQLPVLFPTLSVLQPEGLAANWAAQSPVPSALLPGCPGQAAALPVASPSWEPHSFSPPSPRTRTPPASPTPTPADHTERLQTTHEVHIPGCPGPDGRGPRSGCGFASSPHGLTPLPLLAPVTRGSPSQGPCRLRVGFLALTAARENPATDTDAHSFIQQILLGHLLGAGHAVRPQGTQSGLGARSQASGHGSTCDSCSRSGAQSRPWRRRPRRQESARGPPRLARPQPHLPRVRASQVVPAAAASPSQMRTSWVASGSEGWKRHQGETMTGCTNSPHAKTLRWRHLQTREVV